MKIPRFRKQYHTLNSIEVSEETLRENYAFFSKISGLEIAPVVKSNAYGHGIRLVAKIFDDIGAPFLCVDSLYEAYELLKIQVKTPILIMGYTHPDNFNVKKLPFIYAVYDLETVKALNAHQPGAKIHIFVDTGLNREGVKISELPEFIKEVKSFSNIIIDGLMSHFAAPEDYNHPLTKKQLDNFQLAQKIFKKEHITPKWIHMSNSSALFYTKYYKGKIGNMARAGNDLYGAVSEIKAKNVRPAMKVKTTLAQIKRISKGETIGYDFTFTAKRNMTIGILPYGYYDGMDRGLSNKGFVLIDSTPCPIVGRISMNITTVDISNVTHPYVGQDVIVYSDKASNPNSIFNAAALAGKIERDILVHLASTTRRTVVK